MDLERFRGIPPEQWPADAGKVFLNVLKDTDADECDRILAVRLAGGSLVIDEPLVDGIVEIVEDDSEPVELRVACLFALAPVLGLADCCDYDDENDVSPISKRDFLKIKRALKKIYMDKNAVLDVRRKVLEVSVYATQGWHKAAIREAFESGDRDWMLSALVASGYVGGLDQEVVQAIDSRDEAVRCAALIAAGECEIDEAWPKIKAILQDENSSKPVLLAALESVMGIQPKNVEAVLRTHIASDDPEIKEAARDALAFCTNEYSSFRDGDAPQRWIN